MVVTYMIRELTENVHNHRDLVADLDWYILPVTNPDGYVYSVVDRMWRKTRSPNDGSACTGTDANRNFDYAFGQLPGASDSPCSDAYHGAEAFSEVEIANVRDFILRHKDQIKFFNDMHAAASMVLLPWGYTDERTDDYIDQMNFFTEVI
jgi:murein tripeptide amidase MpaA